MRRKFVLERIALVVVVCCMGSACTQSKFQQLMGQARAAESQHDSVRANQLAKEAFTEAETLGSELHLHEALAFVMHTLNQKPDVIAPFCERAMSFAEKRHVGGDVLYGWADEIGMYYVEHQEYAKAEPYLKVAVDEYVKLHGKDDPHLAGLVDVEPGDTYGINYDRGQYRELANVYEQQGKYALAEPLRRQILSMEEPGLLKVDGRNTDVSGTLEKLADDLVGQKKYQEAEQLYKRAIEIQQSKAKRHPQVNESDQLLRDEQTLLAASALAHLAEQYRQQGRFADSERLFKQVLDCDLVEQGPERVDAEAWKLNYARLLCQTGRKAEGNRLEKDVRKEHDRRIQFNKQ